MIRSLLLLHAVRLAAIGALVLGAWLQVAPAAPLEVGEAYPGLSPATVLDQRAVNADSLATVFTRRNPFRIHRSAATTRYDPNAAGQQVPPPPPARPMLRLVGVILATDTAALIDGLPGVEGTRLVRLGERIGDYQLQRVSRESATVVGPDTTIVLGARLRP